MSNVHMLHEPIQLVFIIFNVYFTKDYCFVSLIRLLSLFVYIMNKTGTAVNKVKTLLKS